MAQEEKPIVQEHYGTIEFDTREKDIVMIWQKTDVIQIERGNIQEVINVLNKQLKK